MKQLTTETVEAQLRDAIDRGNEDDIMRLGTQLDNLTPPKSRPGLMASALWYAEQGLHVFPLRPGRKTPLPGSHGCKDATDDETQIRAWWAEQPDANIGLATGYVFDVVDVDGPLGQHSRSEHWDDIFAHIDADSIGKVLTPRPGGMHIYVPVTGDGNSAGIVPGVDYRGKGGYVLAPPSVITGIDTKDHKGNYQFLGTPRLIQAA